MVPGMDAIKPPGSLKLTGNLDTNWRSFKQQFELYIAAIGASETASKRKVALLLTVAGTEAIEVYNTFAFEPADDKNRLDKVLQKFDEHCLSKKNETYERYVFGSRLQREGEAFDSFLTDLKLKASTCNFGTLRDSLIRDQIVFGICDRKVREKLLGEHELNLEKAVKICQASELARQHAETFDVAKKGLAQQPAQTQGDVDAISFNNKGRGKCRDTRSREKEFRDREFSCKRCGGHHKARQCPAYGKTCSRCNGLNHYAKMCLSRGKEVKERKVHIVNETEEDSDSQSDGPWFVNTVTEGDSELVEETGQPINAVESDKWVAPLLVNGTVVCFRLDTGAKANLISAKDISVLKEKPKIHKRTVPLKTYNGQPVETKGVCRLKMEVKGKTEK